MSDLLRANYYNLRSPGQDVHSTWVKGCCQLLSPFLWSRLFLAQLSPPGSPACPRGCEGCLSLPPCAVVMGLFLSTSPREDPWGPLRTGPVWLLPASPKHQTLVVSIAALMPPRPARKLLRGMAGARRPTAREPQASCPPALSIPGATGPSGHKAALSMPPPSQVGPGQEPQPQPQRPDQQQPRIRPGIL